MNQVTFALQNIKIRLWQAVKILKGYWNFTIRSQRRVGYQSFHSVIRMVLLIETCKSKHSIASEEDGGNAEGHLQ